VLLAEQHHIDIAEGRLAGRGERRGAEHLALVVAARIVAQDRQGRAIEELANRCEIDVVALQVSGRRIVGAHAPRVIEQIDLDARIHHHQLTEETAHGRRVDIVRVGERAVMGDVRRKSA
jgi:hypothetical protein